MVSFLSLLAFGFLLALVTHELGHYVGARLLGGQDVRWGGLFVEASFAPGRRAARAGFLAAGALANFVVAAGTLAVGLRELGGMQLLVGGFALVPWPASDGRKLFQLLRSLR